MLAFGLLGYAAWRERWQLSGAGGVGGVAFASGQRLLVSAVGGAGQDSMDTVWDITDPARPRQLSAFQGGEPTVLSPDGRIVATVSYDGAPVLWNLADPRRPARIAVMQTGGTAPLWGEAYSPDGQILAVAYTDRIFLWDVANAARSRLSGSLAAPVTSAGEASFTPQDITFSPDRRILASVTGTGQVTVWNVSDPARAARIATLTGARDYVQAISLSPRGTLLAGRAGRGVGDGRGRGAHDQPDDREDDQHDDIGERARAGVDLMAVRGDRGQLPAVVEPVQQPRDLSISATVPLPRAAVNSAAVPFASTPAAMPWPILTV